MARVTGTLASLALLLAACRSEQPVRPLGLGTPVDSAELARIDLDAAPDAHGIPAGRGTVDQGAAIFALRCSACHTLDGSPAAGGALANADDESARSWPRSIPRWWPYATTLHDYIGRAMPPDSPGTLTPDERFALVALLLARSGITVPDTLTRDGLVAIEMPARGRFVTSDE